jgi:hypothetical protein
VTAGRCIGEPSDPQRLVRVRPRDRRPVSGFRDRTGSRTLLAAAVPVAGSPKRAWRSQAPLKMARYASGRKATGGRLAPLPWAPGAPRHRFATSGVPWGPRITRPAEHERSRHGGRAVLENVPVSLRAGKGTFSRGHPRESRIGEARHCHQEGRRDARRWPQPTEDHKRPTPPQGGEPERRRDQRRT